MKAKKIVKPLIENALTRSRGIISDGHEIVPTFDIETPEGSLTILCPLPDSHEVRIARLELVSRFMAWKLTTRFVFSTELVEPDAVTAIGVSRRSCLAGIQMIARGPLRFSDVQWVEGVDQIGDEIPGLLPSKFVSLSDEEIVELETAIKAFSPDGFE